MTRLNIGDYAQLSAYGDAVRSALSAHARDNAISVVVVACGRHHSRGVPWEALAVAVGVTASTLRQWRLEYGPGRKDAGATARATGWVNPSRRRAVIRPAERFALITTGHPKPAGNDFGTETAAIRGRLTAAGIDLREHSCLEIGEVQSLLAKHQPAVLHVTAHAAFEGVWLALDGAPYSVALTSIVDAIARATNPPQAVVLNICGSADAAKALAAGVPSVIGWLTPIDDGQAAEFSRQLYRHLAAGSSIGDALDAAKLTINVIWPGLTPVLEGSPLLAPFG